MTVSNYLGIILHIDCNTLDGVKNISIFFKSIFQKIKCYVYSVSRRCAFIWRVFKNFVILLQIIVILCYAQSVMLKIIIIWKQKLLWYIRRKNALNVDLICASSVPIPRLWPYQLFDVYLDVANVYFSKIRLDENCTIEKGRVKECECSNIVWWGSEDGPRWKEEGVQKKENVKCWGRQLRLMAGMKIVFRDIFFHEFKISKLNYHK